MKKNLLILPAVILLLTAAPIFAQQTNRETGIALYKQSKFKEAAKVLGQSLKTDQADAQSWYYFGLAKLKTGELGDGIKALQKAAALAPKEDAIHAALAYGYLLKKDHKNAGKAAADALSLSPKNADALYIAGVVSYRGRDFETAYKRAAALIEANPELASAYLLKSKALMTKIFEQTAAAGTKLEARGQMFDEAAGDLEKFVALSTNAEEKEFYRERLESLKFFASYYKRKDAAPPTDADAPAAPKAGETPLRIIKKPQPSYTSDARRDGVTGSIKLLVGFDADGTVKHIVILQSLGSGLDEEAVKAARGIKFEPEQRDGKPISVAKQIQFSFTLY